MIVFEKIVKASNSIVNYIIYIVLLIALLFGGYSLWDMFKVYNSTRLDQEILKYRPHNGDALSLAEAQKLNPDIKAWIRIEGTKIDYPVVKGVDNFEYLNMDYKKDYSLAGSIFMDYRNAADLSDHHIVLYGHNINGNLMFADVRSYRYEEFFNSHREGHLFTATKDYKLNFFSYVEIDSYNEIMYNVGYSKDHLTDDLITQIKLHSKKYVDIGIKSSDRIVLLSTCFGDGNARSIAIAKIIE